ncbi:dTDP-glucose 4,6-dehydratase [Candidatus Uhrbacteria bacterium RIFCSPHIGHO2_12_FULL_60_25]|uniref:dTDP-glucose 4,6-dehydratase n=1 Tax=Candidatus Uhrbacteria bacterium RIFCSPHIGHO2_12_FULL_60_25 TaxID=1802399 RepID=A0A1F7ULF0_9BACT|nr:MAG: dTDP-glucose 4,6-dehydratase [Candidatus Uhrbacteria bacterium RIFCSPHIGHO2_12_FULL_60_25]
MRILVTGGAGFIGTNYVYFVLARHPNDDVTVLDALTYAGNLENFKQLEGNPRFRFVKGDVCDAALAEGLVKQADAVVHIAAETHVDRSIQDATAFVRTNVLGTQTLLDACRRNGSVRFHHVSTDEVYGSLGSTGAFSETSPYDPRSPYSASKAGADHLVRAAWHTHRVPATISNCSNNYGPYHFPEKIIPLFITNLLEGKKIPLYGDGMNVRDWIYVEDHCAGIDLALRHGRIGETYCFGGRSERSNAELTRLILFEMGFGSDMIEPVTDRPGHDRRYAIDPSKAERELGWSAATPFLHGLRATIQWFKANPDWWKRVKSGAYRDYYEKQYGVRGVTRPVA